MKDTRLLTPEDFCDIEELLWHMKATLRLAESLAARAEANGFSHGVFSGIAMHVKAGMEWPASMIALDISAAQETS